MSEQKTGGGFFACSALLDEDGLRIEVAHLLEVWSQKDTALQLGVSAGYLNDFLHCRRAPGKTLLAGLGYERVTMYRRLPSNAEVSRPAAANEESK